MDLGCAKHFSHNIVDVFVDGVACGRSMGKRVCDQLSEIIRILPGLLQLVSRRLWEPVEHWLEALSMFSLMDAEMVIGSNNEPELMNARTWRARKG